MKTSKDYRNLKEGEGFSNPCSFNEIMSLLIEGVQVIDYQWRYLYVNSAFLNDLKINKEKILASKVTEYNSINRNPAFLAHLQTCMKKRTSRQFECEFIYPDGLKEWLCFNMKPIEEGILILSTKLQKANESDIKLKKALHLNAFISQINQNIVRVKDQATLLHNVCDLAIEFGKFKVAWIGLFDIKDQTINIIDQCGISDEELSFF